MNDKFRAGDVVKCATVAAAEAVVTEVLEGGGRLRLRAGAWSVETVRENCQLLRRPVQDKDVIVGPDGYKFTARVVDGCLLLEFPSGLPSPRAGRYPYDYEHADGTAIDAGEQPETREEPLYNGLGQAFGASSAYPNVESVTKLSKEWAAKVVESRLKALGVEPLHKGPPLLDRYEAAEKRANALADECGRLRDENAELLRENARLRRDVERLTARKPR